MIRIIEHADSRNILSLVNTNREYLRKWLPWLDNTREEADVMEFINRSLSGYAKRESATYVIIHTDRIVGICSFNKIDWINHSGCIGYWLDQSSQGRGYMTSAVNDLLSIGFEKWELHKIEIHAAEHNIKSRRIAENLGFVNTGLIRDAEWLYTGYVSHVIYSLLVSEYQNSRKSNA